MTSRTRYLPNPLICGVRLSVLWGFYRRRWRQHTVVELLASAGIAVGVALVFGVFTASGNIVGSVAEVIHAVDGKATLRISARSSDGFSERLADRAASVPGVKAAALLLRESASISGPHGHQTIQFVGVNAGLIALEGQATKNLGAGALLVAGGVGLPSGVAETVGVQSEGSAVLTTNGLKHPVAVRAVLGAGAIGALASARIGVSLLPFAQALTGQAGRVSEVLISARPGREQQVKRELQTLAAGRANVGPADGELQLAKTAAAPTSQSTQLFAVISVVVGFLLALHAMLLTAPERRRQIAQMRTEGYESRQIVAIFGFQALALGLGASVAGIAVGAALAHSYFGEVPGYLTTAFPITAHQVIHPMTVLVALACGTGAAILASMWPLLDLRPSRPLDAALRTRGEPGQSLGAGVALWGALLGLAIVGLATLLSLLSPRLTIVGGGLLVFAALCVIPLVFRASIWFLRMVATKYHGGMLSVAVIELSSRETLALGLAAIAALAVYGATAVGGARNDLVAGLSRAIKQDSQTTAVWVTSGQSIFNNVDFQPQAGLVARVGRAPGVASVREAQGALLDVGEHRLLIRAHEPSTPVILQRSQLMQGNFTHASTLIRHGGWASVSQGFAEEHGLRLSSAFTLPTPAGPLGLRVAAITTNLGWPPGAITLSTTTFRRGWLTSSPTALEVQLKPGTSLTAGSRSVQTALGASSGLTVQSYRTREAEANATLREGLRSLGRIADLLLLAAALALSVALSTAIYQRRQRLAAQKAIGYDRHQLWRSLIIESTVVLAIGCLDGAIVGLYGHALADRYLRLSTGFPAPFTVGVPYVTLTLLFVAAISLFVLAVFGYFAAGVSPTLAFQE
jgi:putative ABC transport system permease protein